MTAEGGDDASKPSKPPAQAQAAAGSQNPPLSRQSRSSQDNPPPGRSSAGGGGTPPPATTARGGGGVGVGRGGPSSAGRAAAGGGGGGRGRGRGRGPGRGGRGRGAPPPPPAAGSAVPRGEGREGSSSVAFPGGDGRERAAPARGRGPGGGRQPPPSPRQPQSSRSGDAPRPGGRGGTPDAASADAGRSPPAAGRPTASASRGGSDSGGRGSRPPAATRGGAPAPSAGGRTRAPPPPGRGPGRAVPGRSVPRRTSPRRKAPPPPQGTVDPNAVRYRPSPNDDASSDASSILVPPEEVTASLNRLNGDLPEADDGAVDDLLVRSGARAYSSSSAATTARTGTTPAATTAAAAAAGASYTAYVTDLTGYYCREAHVYSQHGSRQVLSYARDGAARGAAYARTGLAVVLSLLSDLLWGCSRGDYTLVQQNIDERHTQLHRSCLRRPRNVFLYSLSLCAGVFGLTHLHYNLHRGQYKLANDQSYGFFTDVPESTWLEYQRRARTSKHHAHQDWRTYIDDPGAWYHSNWDPDFTCPDERRVGGGGGGASGVVGAGVEGTGDGPKWVCDPHRIVDAANERTDAGRGWFGHRQGSNGEGGCLIYSIGVNGGDFGFEVGMRDLLARDFATPGGDGRDRIGVKSKHHRRPSDGSGDDEYGCEIHVFDPAGQGGLPPRGQMIPPGVHYHPWGIKSVHSTPDSLQAGGPDADFKTFRRTVEELGHVGRVVDVLKVDCKMCEWSIYEDWFPSGGSGLERIGQILVEVHGSPEEYVEDFFERMRTEGYVAFHKEVAGGALGGTCVDYAFVKLREDFFFGGQEEGTAVGSGGARR